MEVETIKKSQRATTLEIETLRKISWTTQASIIKSIQEIEERIPDAIENIDTIVKENVKCKKLLTPTIQEIHDTIRSPNLRIIGVEVSDDS